MPSDLEKPLLGKRAPRPSKGLFDEGSAGSTLLLLSSSSIGTGVLALPYGVSCVGILPALALFAVAGIAAYASNLILFCCVLQTGVSSYGELMIGILGRHGATVLDAFVAVEGIGAVASYLVFIMDYVPQICQLAGEDSWCTDRGNVAVAVAMVIWPLSCFKGLSALRYISTCSIATILFTSFVVVVKAPGLFAGWGRPFSYVLVQTHVGPSSFQVLSMACFAFMTHTNTPEIASGFLAPSTRRVQQVLGFQTVALWIVYCSIGVCGFVSFLDHIDQDFLTNYAVKDASVTICRAMLSATLIFGCPINLFPSMQALFNILDRVSGKAPGSLYDSAVSRIPVTTACFAASLAIALRTPHVADLIATMSAFMGAPLMFMFPALMYIYTMGGKNKLVPVSLIALTVSLWIAEFAHLLGWT